MRTDSGMDSRRCSGALQCAHTILAGVVLLGLLAALAGCGAGGENAWIATVEKRLTALESRVAPASPAPAQESRAGAIDALERSISSLGARVDDLARARAPAAAPVAAGGADTALLQQLSADVAALKAAVEELRAKVDVDRRAPEMRTD